MNWRKDSSLGIRPDSLLKDMTTFRIGGKAKVFASPPDEDSLRRLIAFARKDKLPVFILGAGSNILASDGGVHGLVVKLDSPFFTKLEFRGSQARAGGGLMLARFISMSAKRSLSGLESLSGIPGTVGGALMMNAGAWGKCISAQVKEIRVMDRNGNIRSIGKKAAGFGYRSSKLGRYIILGAVFSLVKSDRRRIESVAKKILAQRRQSQDNTLPNAGCIFKNPANDSAGRLIDACELKGRRVGGAAISSVHANFILNKGNARSREVLRLMELAKKRVKSRFKVNLEPEIRLWK